MGGAGSGDPVPTFHEKFAGAGSNSLAIVVLEIFTSESDGGQTLVTNLRILLILLPGTVNYLCEKGVVLIA